jgi:ATP-binding cassette subfamily C protein
VVLRGASLEAPAGAFIAIVGASGAGKSTLLDLIAGLREPDAGAVLVDGVPLDRIDRRAWRARIGYVPQESVLLHDTIVANVLLGAEWVGAEAAARAVERAGAGEMMAARGEGVGERGLRLSGGERRRLALARALVAAPRLLLLDEPTSELDSASSAAIAGTLRALSGSMTIIAVTHDPRLAAAADAVYLLDGGRLSLLPAQSPLAESHRTASASSSGAIQWPMS